MSYSMRSWATPPPQTSVAYPTPSSEGAFPYSPNDGEESPTVRKVLRAAKVSKSPVEGRSFSWSKTHRQALHLMQLNFNLKIDDITRVFNDIFKEDIITQGSDQGVSKGKIAAQYNEQKREAKSWREVGQVPRSDQEAAELEQLHMAIHQSLRTPAPRVSIHANSRNTIRVAQPTSSSRRPITAPTKTCSPKRTAALRNSRLVTAPALVQQPRRTLPTISEALQQPSQLLNEANAPLVRRIVIGSNVVQGYNTFLSP